MEVFGPIIRCGLYSQWGASISLVPMGMVFPPQRYVGAVTGYVVVSLAMLICFRVLQSRM